MKRRELTSLAPTLALCMLVLAACGDAAPGAPDTGTPHRPDASRPDRVPVDEDAAESVDGNADAADAAIDSGDAGPSADAAEPDAASSDGGEADAAEGDAAETDADGTDGSVLDASEPDGSAPDADIDAGAADVGPAAQIVHYVYDLEGNLIAEHADDGSVLAEYVYLDGRLVSVFRGGVPFAVQTDHLGAPRAVLSASGQVVWSWSSEPYGGDAPIEDPDGDGTDFVLDARLPKRVTSPSPETSEWARGRMVS